MHFNAMPEAPFHLARVLLADEETVDLPETIRAMSGLILKNLIKQNGSVPAGMLKFMVDLDLWDVLMMSSSPMVKSSISSLLSTIILVSQGGVFDEDEKDLLGWLCTPLGIGTVEKMLEDGAVQLVHGHPEQIDRIVGFLIKYINDDRTDDELELEWQGNLRRAITALCHVLPLFEPEHFSLPSLLTGFGKIGHIAVVQRSICQCLNVLAQNFSTEMVPNLPAALQYTFSIFSQPSKDDATAQEATEFWLGLVELDQLGQFLSQQDTFIKDQLIPVLLNNMRYAPDAPEILESSTSDDQDRDEDIAPRHHRQAKEKDLSGGVEEGEVGEDDPDEADYEWTLRKSSAATLDALSGCLEISQVFLPSLLPHIERLFSSESWLDAEVAVLAVGAVAEGSRHGMEAHLPALLPHLINLLKSEQSHPLIKTITAWTLGRYVPWISRHEAVGSQVMEALLYSMLSTSKPVQRASCSALTRFVESAPNLIDRVMPAILTCLKPALLTYPKRSLILAYDLIRGLADELPEVLSAALRSNSSILYILSEKFEALPFEGDQAMFPLLEAWSSLAIAAGSLMGDLSPTLLKRALGMVRHILDQSSANEDDVDYDVAIVSFDLIGGMVTGLGPVLQGQLDASELQSLIVRGLAEQVTEVRQSVFALIGDMASHGLAPCLEASSQYICHAIVVNHCQSEETSIATANNAVWAAGELALHAPTMIVGLLEPLWQIICQLLTSHATSPSSNKLLGYLDNCAVAAGRILGALLVTQGSRALTHLPSLPLEVWCGFVLRLDDPAERESCLLPVLRAAQDHGVPLAPSQRTAMRELALALQTQIDGRGELADRLRSLLSSSS